MSCALAHRYLPSAVRGRDGSPQTRAHRRDGCHGGGVQADRVDAGDGGVARSVEHPAGPDRQRAEARAGAAPAHGRDRPRREHHPAQAAVLRVGAAAVGEVQEGPVIGHGSRAAQTRGRGVDGVGDPAAAAAGHHGHGAGGQLDLAQPSRVEDVAEAAHHVQAPRVAERGRSTRPVDDRAGSVAGQCRDLRGLRDHGRRPRTGVVRGERVGRRQGPDTPVAGIRDVEPRSVRVDPREPVAEPRLGAHAVEIPRSVHLTGDDRGLTRGLGDAHDPQRRRPVQEGPRRDQARESHLGGTTHSDLDRCA